MGTLEGIRISAEFLNPILFRMLAEGTLHWVTSSNE